MIALLALLAACATGAEAEEPRGLPLIEIAADTTWSGEVRVEGRVRVREGATLRIAPGTRILVRGAAGRERVDEVRLLPGIEVSGLLLAEGTREQPIMLQGLPPDDDGHAEWNGILLESGPAGRRHQARWCIFDRLSIGIQDAAPSTLIDRCTFCDCRVAINAGFAFRDYRLHAMTAGSSSIRQCRFGWCETALTLGFSRCADVSRCWFLECELGVSTSAEDGVMQLLERCEFDSCTTCVERSCCAMNCIFEDNDTVFRPWGADLAVRTHNLCVRNRVIMEGDGDPGDLRRADAVGRLGARPDSDPDLLAQLRVERTPWATLKPTSPGHGYATDAGDVGIESDVGAGPTNPPTPDLGVQPTHLLVLGPPEPTLVDSVPQLVVAHAATPPRPGDVEGALQWILLTVEEASHLQQHLGLTAPLPRMLCAVLDGRGVLEGELSLGWDGIARAWWNGAPLALPTTPRRARPGDTRVKVKAKAGANVLMVEQRPRQSTGGIEIAFAAPPGRADAVAWRAAPPTTALRPPAPPRTPIARVGKEKAGPVSLEIMIPLPAGARWIELMNLGAFQLRDAEGVETSLRDAKLTLDPRNTRLGLRIAERLPAGAYELVLPRLRNAVGQELAPVPPLVVRVPK